MKNLAFMFSFTFSLDLCFICSICSLRNQTSKGLNCDSHWLDSEPSQINELFMSITHISFKCESLIPLFCPTPPAGCFVTADSVHSANGKGSKALKTVSLSISLD